MKPLEITQNTAINNTIPNPTKYKTNDPQIP